MHGGQVLRDPSGPPECLGPKLFQGNDVFDGRESGVWSASCHSLCVLYVPTNHRQLQETTPTLETGLCFQRQLHLRFAGVVHFDIPVSYQRSICRHVDILSL